LVRRFVKNWIHFSIARFNSNFNGEAAVEAGEAALRLSAYRQAGRLAALEMAQSRSFHDHSMTVFDLAGVSSISHGEATAVS
jgi:hypothetical protein